ncbi:hypothetical protein L1987_70523 [Smallanthus sonchifolius]|uniref:Uncharacterized protein n=1 Tax=Smallanthus sonchifolius TaxID=185202 RepID=A0ACB9AP34_9ASTR|nr:hypothetical protein L1987_70523 [Smallanthus sonchifolius]
MEKYRSQSCRDGGMIDNNIGFPTNMKNLRSCTTWNRDTKKPASNSKNWSIKDPDLQRKKRVVGYKVYSMESKMKGSFKKSFGWIKHTYNQLLYGYK